MPLIFRIYKITCPTDGDSLTYYGSTMQTLQQRFSMHKSSYKGWLKGKSNRDISSFRLFERYGAENCTITEIEKPATEQLMHARERYYISTFNCVNIMLNSKLYKKVNPDDDDT